MTPETHIELHNITERFGKLDVLGRTVPPIPSPLSPTPSSLNPIVPAGKTYAFLGRNGAGKTTTIRMLMGLFKPDPAPSACSASIPPRCHGHPPPASATSPKINKCGAG